MVFVLGGFAGYFVCCGHFKFVKALGKTPVELEVYNVGAGDYYVVGDFCPVEFGVPD